MRAALLGLLLLLPGCIGLPALPELSALPGLSALWEAPPPEAEPDPPQAMARPPEDTPSIRLAWRGSRALALLIQENGENRLWRSAGGLAVATDGARIVATAGLREWIASTRLDGPDPLDEPLALVGQSATLRRQVDLMRSDRSPDSMRFGLALNCRLTASMEGAAVLVLEHCRRRGGGSFTNRYWADPQSGGIYRSEQWVGEAGMMRLEVVNPPS
ncbi:YjbF family lipoprotein [Roseomonas sp. E05]|uniref:YjbF family lipoprotein n=1 Tax=Roseomonas sp. E05 TaxID=3046310 RepID=UPI0024BA8CB8|nr:YjbF family lipoprotein [Roseomonas sp. E05]MDJ0390134.1 YjbF family lipoprotein [Roseomonas sp. E05]